MLRDVVLEEAKRILRFTKMSGPNNVGGPCPFHKDGQERRPSFYINLNTGVFMCHTCEEKGTFVQLLKRLGGSSRTVDLVMQLAKEEHVETPVRAFDYRGLYILEEALLGAFDYCPVKLIDDGFDESILRSLDVGFDKEYRRITFPIRNYMGELVGISGRTVCNEEPRYMVYKSAHLRRFAPEDDRGKYARYDIKNHLHLWNMHNVFPGIFYETVRHIIVVEGYKANMWLIQQGFPNTVALMGSKTTLEQENLLCKFQGDITLMLDHNKAGISGTLALGRRLTNRGQNVRVFPYAEDAPEGTQPDNLTRDVITAGLDSATPYMKWRLKCQMKIKRYEAPSYNA